MRGASNADEDVGRFRSLSEARIRSDLWAAELKRKSSFSCAAGVSFVKGKTNDLPGRRHRATTHVTYPSSHEPGERRDVAKLLVIPAI